MTCALPIECAASFVTGACPHEGPRTRLDRVSAENVTGPAPCACNAGWRHCAAWTSGGVCRQCRREDGSCYDGEVHAGGWR